LKPLKESDAWPAQPDAFYGIEKLFTEKVCEAANRDYGKRELKDTMDAGIRVARFHNVFGEVFTAFDKEKGKAPCHLIWKVMNCPDGGEIEVWGDGKATRSFLYIDDCIDGILKLINSDYPYPVNIGSDRLVTVDELANIIIGISGKKIGLRHDLTKPQGVRGRNASLDLVKEVLGWQPKISLEEGLRRTYQWAEKNRDILEV
jgi:nucleoside-diphosphate-sugar epimerase